MTRRAASSWYAVRCIFRWTGPYEERITLWHAADLDAATALAEAEAEAYAKTTGVTYLGLAQAYEIGEEQPGPGSEVFSLLRTSALPPPEYLDRFFDTGGEHQTRDGTRRVATLYQGERSCGYLFAGPDFRLEFLRAGDDDTWYYSDRTDPEDYDTATELASGEIDWYGTTYSARWLPDGEAREIEAYFDRDRPRDARPKVVTDPGS
ncbi:hypothetical protein [Amycolatopsis sp. lyj-109]|uniref:hypothetical protein n=1 Tax=Amycolatopsis sp. lyj-109 TaxID=2789287 RepID=UPI003978EB6D